MKKSDLEDFMIVEIDFADKYFIKFKDRFLSKNSRFLLKDIDEDLNWNDSLSINRVYKIKAENVYDFDYLLESYSRELIWDRNKIK